MNCKYFGTCGSCTLYDLSYEKQLSFKKDRELDRFKDISKNLKISLIKSKTSNFRNRAEFKIWKDYDEDKNPTLSYAMTSLEKEVIAIKECKIVSKHISEIMKSLLPLIKNKNILKNGLFSVEFLNSTTNDMLVTLIYHRKLNENWIEEARLIEKKLNIKIIGRSRKQKIVLTEDFINEELTINEKKFIFNYKEGGFTQPNTNVNIQMVQWVLNNMDKDKSKDLCELYCGGGNFTIPLSNNFNKVLATEISKTSIKSALKNCELNNINNINFIRMSSEEFSEALNKKRIFRRLKDTNLDNYNFSTIFVDPPRAGLDDTTTKLIKKFDQIIYISCNPETLHRDLKNLSQTHKVEKFALFDQFAYTKHIECGVILKKQETE